VTQAMDFEGLTAPTGWPIELRQSLLPMLGRRSPHEGRFVMAVSGWPHTVGGSGLIVNHYGPESARTVVGEAPLELRLSSN
jgi:hypothetical protein